MHLENFLITMKKGSYQQVLNWVKGFKSQLISSPLTKFGSLNMITTIEIYLIEIEIKHFKFTLIHNFIIIIKKDNAH